MFKKPSHYFFNISFDWKDVFDLLEISEEDRMGLKVSSEFRFDSPNGHGNDVGMNDSDAMFEYYIMPGVLSNAGFKDDSTIFDCQLKRFFSTINLVYREVLIDETDEDKTISCSFERFAGKEKSIFTVIYHDSTMNRKFLSLVFPEEYLNRQNAHKEWGKLDQVRVFSALEEMGGETKVTEVEVPKSVFLNILLQSEHDASSGLGIHRRIMDVI
jgi:hypothetical protein